MLSGPKEDILLPAHSVCRPRFGARRAHLVALTLALLPLLVAARAHPQGRPPGAKGTPGAATAAQSKGIWEPINYPDDVDLGSVFFVNDQVGWIGGKGSGGFLLHTTDGGNHWDIQLGDPHSSSGAIWALQFLDASHGWAVQDGTLIRTSDGQRWESIGPFAPGPSVTAFRFTTVRDGFEVAGDYSGSSIYATHDGGHSWKKVFECMTTLQVNGLTRKTSCYLRDVYFVNTRVGYAVGGGFNDPWAVVVKTVDGGATWTVVFATTDFDTISAVSFTDETNGVIRLHGSLPFITSDGGQSWRGGTGLAGASIKFADPEVAWSCTDIRCSTTVDGGRSWTARSNPFPVGLVDYSVPRRDRAFVVGSHGMIYRYRVVPGDYAAKGMLEAPLLPTYGGAIVGQLQQMQTQAAALQTAINSAPVTPAGGSPTSAPPPTPSPSSATSASTVAPAGASGGFSQDTSGAGTFAQSTAGAPTSQFVQSCCASQVQGMQSSYSGVTQQVPQFTGAFRNLNLLFVGLNMYTDLTSRAKQMRDAFMALKQAPDAATALAALVTLTTDVQGASQAVTTQFQSLTSSGTAGSSSTVYQSSAVQSSSAQPPASAGSASGTPASTPASAPASAPASGASAAGDSAASRAASAAGSSAKAAATQAVTKVLPKLPF